MSRFFEVYKKVECESNMTRSYHYITIEADFVEADVEGRLIFWENGSPKKYVMHIEDSEWEIFNEIKTRRENEMVDYSFLEQANGKKRGRVEFFDVELPEIPGKQLTTTDRVRQQIKAGEAGLESMQKEADALTVESPDDFSEAVEMIGQLKNLKKSLTDAVNQIIQPLYQEYKSGRNILTSFTPKLDAIQAAIKEKQDAYAYKAEMARREAERRAADEAAKLQAKIDAEKKEMDEAEKKKAKKEKREPVFHEPIVVDTPVVPKEIKATTESGSAKIEMVLVPTITNAKSEYVIDKVLYYFEKQFMDLALKAANKAIKAGAIGLKGAPGISVQEKAVTKHRRR